MISVDAASVGDATRAAGEARPDVVVRIRPERWLGTDFAKQVAQV